MSSENCSNLIRELIAIIAHTHTHSHSLAKTHTPKNSQLFQGSSRIQLINGYLPSDADEGENH